MLRNSKIEKQSMKNKLYFLLLLLVASNVQAQTEDFSAFRERMMNDYQGFRKDIMERYVEFLDAAWTEYEAMSGRRRVAKPKPVVAPVYTPPSVPVVEEEEEPMVVEPEEEMVSDSPTTPELPKAPVTPSAPQTPKVPVVPSPEIPQIQFTLYGLQLTVPAPKVEPTLGYVTQQEVVRFWKKIHESDNRACVEIMKQYAENYRLGDWCTFKAIEVYCEAWAKGNTAACRVMMQYLMLSLGYDVRMAIAGDKVYLMLPFEQLVYENTYLTVNNNRYYIYPKNVPDESRMYSCDVPADVDCGREMNLIINPAYRLPKKNQPFALSYGGLSIQGVVNKNVIDLQQQYPSMDIYCYAASTADAEVKRMVVKQLKEQLAGLGEADAANVMLHFVQKAFEYKTDEQQFGDGVEKSFFFDETLYFPYCDCEDRSIFYAYLIHEVLGLDVLLVGYPGHECTAVALSVAPQSAVGFTYRGKTYYICDPTYIGANIGVCMPDYVNVRPEIEEWY